MTLSFLTTGAVIAVAIACVSCDKIRPTQPLPELQKPPNASSPAGQQEKNLAFTQSAQKELDEIGAVIAELRAKSDTASLQAKAKMIEDVERFEAELRETQKRLTELKLATIETWNQLRESFANSFEKLKNGVDKVRKNAV